MGWDIRPRVMVRHAAFPTATARNNLGCGLALLWALLFCTTHLRAQAVPEKESRTYASVSVAWDVQPLNCTTCQTSARAAGPAVEALIGVRLGRGLGLGIAGRAFQQLSYEYNQSSKYVLLVGQYRRPAWKNLTLNAGAGHARHEAERSTAAARYSEDGIAVYGGISLRVPSRSRIGLVTNLGVIQTVSGSRAFRPWTVTFGVGLSVID